MKSDDQFGPPDVSSQEMYVKMHGWKRMLTKSEWYLKIPVTDMEFFQSWENTRTSRTFLIRFINCIGFNKICGDTVMDIIIDNYPE